MKKRPNNYVLRTIAVVLCSTLFACQNDNEVESFWVSSATPNIVEGAPTEIITDSGNYLTVINNYSGSTLSNTQRIFAQYQVINQNVATNHYDINLLGVRNILTKNIVTLTPENEALIGNDPVEPYDVWFSSGYVSINFGFYYGGTSTHSVNLVQSSVNPNPEDQKVYLEFRHNDFGDPMVFAQYGTVSFNVEEFMKSPGEDVTFVILFNEFIGEQSYEFTYNFQVPSSTKQSISTERISLEGYN